MKKILLAEDDAVIASGLVYTIVSAYDIHIPA